MTDHPREPIGEEAVWYRGWEAVYSWQHEYWTGEGYCACLGGPDLDCLQFTAATWAELLEQIDDYEDNL